MPAARHLSDPNSISLAEPVTFSQSDLDRLAEVAKGISSEAGFVMLEREGVKDQYNPGDKLNGYVVCDPKGTIAIGWLKHGWPGSVDVIGQWCPGQHHPWWGPTGNSSAKYPPGVNANKWGAIVIVCASTSFPPQPDPSDCVAYQYPGHPINIQHLSNAAPNGVWVLVRMNDDDYRDNFNHPTDPMRARIA